MKHIPYLTLLMVLLLYGCKNVTTKDETINMNNLEKKLDQYTEVILQSDISSLSENEKKMLPILFEIADIMDDLFWNQAFGNKDTLLNTLTNDGLRQLVLLNYGPWDRLNGNVPFIARYGAKPAGANFYPSDMTKEEFEQLSDTTKYSPYTFIRRDTQGTLYIIPYHEYFRKETARASILLLKASEYADDPGLKKYLQLRASAFTHDDYFESDLAWMGMKDNTIDFVVGPIENYEDQLLGYKTAYEAFILIKDKEWSAKLNHYCQYLPELQKNLPVEAVYKTEKPGTHSDLGVYEVLYYAGDCNAGSKTIAINLPNDERVHTIAGSRRLQLKNTMHAKFDKILVPIAELLISKEQLKYIRFDAFFENVMFHEIAHGLGVFNTIDGKGTVREALKENYAIMEEGKADILGLYLVTQLHEMGVMKTPLMDNYVTFMAGIFRSVRFGASSSHAKANLIRFNYFREKGAFKRSIEGKYEIDFEKMKDAVHTLSTLILTLQGGGDYEQAAKLIKEKGIMDKNLEDDLLKLGQKDIPIDIIFKQGPEVLRL